MGEIELKVGLPTGIRWCKSQSVICSEGIKLGKSWPAKGFKML